MRAYRYGTGVKANDLDVGAWEVEDRDAERVLG